MMTLEQLVPTVNEIALNAIDADRDRLQRSPTAFRPSRFFIGDKVKFSFNGRRLIGHITNLFCRNGITTYHIITASNTWYQHIDQEAVTAIQ